MKMRILKIALILSIALVSINYGYASFAKYINNHIDKAAAVIITKTMTANIIFNLEKYEEIQTLIKQEKISEASDKLKILTDVSKDILSYCKLKQCTAAIAKYSN